MEYITTYTEKHFYPLLPNPADLDPTDIAHSLSLQCRGNGHTKTFFSVAHHCINCAMEAEARGYSPRLVFACLIHDASEAYMCDIPRPLKHELPSYIEAEEKLLSIIYSHFLGSDLTEEEARLVKIIDDDMLYFDLKCLLNEDMGCQEPKLHISLDYSVSPFEKDEQEWLSLFNRLSKSSQACS